MKYGSNPVREHIQRLVPVLLILLVIGCGAKPKPYEGEIRRIFLIVVDTLRGDHLGCAGGPVATPNLDALAARGVRFSQARAHIPITGPSHSSLFTSLLPSEHGVLNNTQVLAGGFETLPELVRDHGMRTAAFISLGVLKDRFGLSQGFDSYDQQFDYSWDRNASEISDAVIPWMEAADDHEPFLVWAHYSDPHAPYTAPGRPFAACRVLVDGNEVAIIPVDGQTVSIPATLSGGRAVVTLEYPEDCDIRPNKIAVEGLRTVPKRFQIRAGKQFIRAPQKAPVYVAKPPAQFEVFSDDSEIGEVEIRFSLKDRLTPGEARTEYGFEVEYVDREIGRLMAAIVDRGWMDDSLVIFVGDHGEGIGDHDHIGHIDQLYDSLLHVPLIMVASGVLPEGHVVDQAVSLVDVLPTVAQLIGFSAPADITGRSLVPLMEVGGTLPDIPHVALTARPQADSNLEAIIVDGWKLIRKRETGQVSLFDLSTDPGELTDLAPQNPDRVAQLNRTLDEHLSTSISASAWAELDDESRSRLEALGYIN